MSEGRDLVKEALQDAKSLRDAAVESAKNQLVEQLAPAVRKLLNESIRGALDEDRPKKSDKGGIEAHKPGKDQPGLPDKYNDFEAEAVQRSLEDALQEFFPSDGKQPVKENDMADESKDKAPEAEKNEAVEPVAEEIEISDAELRKVYEAALQTEVQVKKGFSDIIGGGELDDASKVGGIAPRAGEKHFDQQDPPAKKDFTVKEMLQRGLAENKQLREQLRKAAAMIETLGKKLHEVNLFNAKVLHVNKILNSGAKLTKEQKTFVMESIDKARSISEVKMVFETIVGSFKSAASLQEQRNPRPPKADSQRARTTPGASEVLSESVDRETKPDPFARMRQLAGLVNGKKE